MTFESRERFVITRPCEIKLDRCFACGSSGRFLPISDAARRCAVKQREIFRWVEEGNLGFIERTDGVFLVCLDCIGKVNKLSFSRFDD